MNNSIIEIKNLRKDYHVGRLPYMHCAGWNLKLMKENLSPLWEQAGRANRQCLISSDASINRLSGDYLLDGINVNTMNNDALARFRNKKLGFVFQAYNLLARTTALENVELPLFYNPKIRSRERKEAALRALEAVGSLTGCITCQTSYREVSSRGLQ